MWTVNFLSLTTDFEMSETCELLSWYLRGCNLIEMKFHQWVLKIYKKKINITDKLGEPVIMFCTKVCKNTTTFHYEKCFILHIAL